MDLNISINEITFKTYETESELDQIVKLVESELSEPYSIFTYRYFLTKWPKLCILVIYFSFQYLRLITKIK